MPRTPSYRQRRGYTQAIVTLTDSITKKRRDYWLGEHSAPESRERYHRLIAEWEVRGRRLPPADFDQPVAARTRGITVSKVIHEYWRHVSKLEDQGEFRSFCIVLRLLRRYFGRTPASEFGPKKLRFLRDEMIRGGATENPPRKPWSRKYINVQVQRIRRLFKWATAHELLPVSVHQSLSTLEPLRRGRSSARETDKVGPVPQHLLNGVRPHLSRPVRALVELQLLTGARPGELLGMRPVDIEIDERTRVWTFKPETHKNAYREHERVIYFGPRAQQVLRSFLFDRPMTAYCFSPAEAERERRATLHATRKTPLSYGNRPGTNRRCEPRRKAGERYTAASYHRAVQYACNRAFPPPAPLSCWPGETKKAWQARLTPAQREELRTWRRQHRFHPHQLRHNAATLLRREFGLEAAQLALGHASAQITDAVYAERDRAKVIEIMRKIG